MHYSAVALVTLLASSNLVTALPTRWDTDIIARDPGFRDSIKKGWDAITGKKAGAVAATCGAGAVWSGTACIAQLVPAGPGKNIAVGTGIVGGLVGTQSAATAWKDANKKPAPDIEQGHGENHELLPPNMMGGATVGPAPAAQGGSQHGSSQNGGSQNGGSQNGGSQRDSQHGGTPPPSPPPSRPASPHMPGHLPH